MNKPATSKVFIAVLIIQSIANILLAIFIWSLFTNPDSEFNKSIQSTIQSYADQFKPISITGDKGEQGVQGEKGDTGPQGHKGDQGDDGTTGTEGASIQGSQGEKGDTGETGAQGPAGDNAEWRCNSQTAHMEYKYPSDEDWSDTGGVCFPL